MRATRALGEDYAHIFGMQPDMDVALAAQLLHDLHKPWVFQWQTDGTCRTEQPLAATGEHHVLSVAESIKRKLPAEVVVAQSCAHTHPGTDKDKAQVVSWITAAALLAGVDPVRSVAALQRTGFLGRRRYLRPVRGPARRLAGGRCGHDLSGFPAHARPERAGQRTAAPDLPGLAYPAGATP